MVAVVVTANNVIAAAADHSHLTDFKAKENELFVMTSASGNSGQHVSIGFASKVIPDRSRLTHRRRAARCL
jgi:hypothetical protein